MGGVVPLTKFLKSHRAERYSRMKDVDLAKTPLEDCLDDPASDMLLSEDAAIAAADDEAAPMTEPLSRSDLDAAYERGVSDTMAQLNDRLKVVVADVERSIEQSAEVLEGSVIALCSQILETVGQQHIAELLICRVVQDIRACLARAATRAVYLSGDEQLMALLAERLDAMGIAATLTRQPGGESCDERKCNIVVEHTRLDVDLQAWLDDFQACLR